MDSEPSCAGLSMFYLVGLLLSHFTDKEMQRLSNFPKVSGQSDSKWSAEERVVPWTSWFGAHVEPKGGISKQQIKRELWHFKSPEVDSRWLTGTDPRNQKESTFRVSFTEGLTVDMGLQLLLRSLL